MRRVNVIKIHSSFCCYRQICVGFVFEKCLDSYTKAFFKKSCPYLVVEAELFQVSFGMKLVIADGSVV